MIHKCLSALILTLAFFTTQGQHYYKDLISNKQLLKEMAVYKDREIHEVSIHSFEDDGSPSDGFYCRKKISKDYRKVELLTKSRVSSPSVFTSFFNEEGNLLRTNDSSDIAITQINYTYDQLKRIISILSKVRSRDDDFTNEILEEHLYYYGDFGVTNQPEKMIRVRNRRDSTVILFALDEKNNISLEKDTKTGTKFYYYYDASNRLTDVVQANEFKSRLLPDYLFEYDNKGNVTQMTSVEEGSNNYYIWKYSYEDGLRIKERIFSKEKRLLGSITYEYN